MGRTAVQVIRNFLYSSYHGRYEHSDSNPNHGGMQNHLKRSGKKQKTQTEFWRERCDLYHCPPEGTIFPWAGKGALALCLYCNGHPLQYCLENPMDRGAWQATVHRVAKSWTQLKWLSTHSCTHKALFSGDQMNLSLQGWVWKE